MTNTMMALQKLVPSILLQFLLLTSFAMLSSTSFNAPSPYCSGELEKQNREVIKDPLCSLTKCSSHASCYLGSCVCNPGYTGSTCTRKLEPANPWYTQDCFNLKQESTLNLQVPLSQIGGEFRTIDGRLTRNKDFCGKDGNTGSLLACAYLCYSHPDYGVAMVPKSLWKDAQGVEQELWVSEGKYLKNNANDRAEEHFISFHSFNILLKQNLTRIGRVVEVGAGPWTQFRYILYSRPELVVDHFTIWEPSAAKYMESVASCSYKDGKSLQKFGTSMMESIKHSFPVTVVSRPGERIDRETYNNVNGTYSNNISPSLAVTAATSAVVYDTLISINVLEHVQDAFHYLTNLYTALRPGGLLIFHERYYEDHLVSKGDRYHPIRIKRVVLDHFLSGFDILFNNCSATYGGRGEDKGYYVIARKR